MRRRFDDAVIQSYRAPPPLSSLFFLVFLFFFSFLRPPSLPSPSSSSARASYFERGIRGRNRKRHGRASNRYSIAVSPRTGPSLSAGSTISNSIENSFFLSLEIFFPNQVGRIFLFIRLGSKETKVKNYHFKGGSNFEERLICWWQRDRACATSNANPPRCRDVKKCYTSRDEWRA